MATKTPIEDPMIDPRTGGLQATSAFGLDMLRTDQWLPGPEEAALVDEGFARRTPMLVADAYA